jgi:hypothetical protein
MRSRGFPVAIPCLFETMGREHANLDCAAEYLGDRRDTVELHYHAWLQNRTARPLLASELTPNVLANVLAAVA